MADLDMSLQDILGQQLKVLCGADGSIIDQELEMFSQRERRAVEEDNYIIPFPQDFSVRPPPTVQRRKAA